MSLDNGKYFYDETYKSIILQIKKGIKDEMNTHPYSKFRINFLLKKYLTMLQCDWIFKNPLQFEQIINHELKKQGWDSKSWITYGNRKDLQLYFKFHHYQKMKFKTVLYPKTGFFTENTEKIKKVTNYCYVDLRR